MFEHGLVIGKFYPFHIGHAHLIRTALQQSRMVTVEVLGSSVESISVGQRMGWVRSEHPTARVVGAIDDYPVDYTSDAAWTAHLVVITDLLNGTPRVDAVFTSDDYGAELAERLGATWVQVDSGRVIHPVSGRAIRADLDGMWWALPPAVQRDLEAVRHDPQPFADPLPEVRA